MACVRDGDLRVFDVDSGRERRITSGASGTITHGLAEFVAQEEMDRDTGYWWSGDSQKIAYEQADASGVETLHVFDATHPEIAGEPTYYPRPGKRNVKVKLGVIPAAGGAPFLVFGVPASGGLSCWSSADGGNCALAGPIAASTASNKAAAQVRNGL